ncbi:pilus assembly PilX N-terminal domain-containing protein [Bacillus sp. X1(2014)]|uniref:pilus assembly PilX N-terminal domain-containing protein n=1 Tax=Bacillus sp. X1(2014) TaxID=1565991 RepID=UPI0011A1C34B|nr:pilus assembly PilX N-terminal domain-containing protein [Bacillus sp. X1(2014)]
MEGNKEGLLNTIKNEKGMALISVLIVFVVITILGVGIITLAASNMKMSTGERDNQSAYYIAESGITNEMKVINSLIPDMYKSSTILSDFFLKFDNEFVLKEIPVYDNFEESFGQKPYAKIKIEPVSNINVLNPFTRDYKITSTGTINNRSRSVVKIIHLTWNPKSNIKIASDTVLFLGTDLDWHNTPAEIIGTVGLGKDAYTKFTGSKTPQIKEYADVTINEPEFPVYTIPPNSRIFTDSKLIMDNDMYFSRITVNSNSTLEINVGDKNRSIIVDRLEFLTNGKLKISGTGNLTIYVKTLSMSSGTIINTDGEASISKLNIFLEGSGSQINNGVIYGSMFTKNTPEINTSFSINDTTGVQGSFITGGRGTITLNSNRTLAEQKAKMIFAPLANIDAQLNFKGTIVAKTFTSNGNNHGFVFTQPVNPPFYIDNGTVNISVNNLITSEPIMEK